MMSTPLEKLFLQEVAASLKEQPSAPPEVISEHDLAHLPSPLQRYFRYAGYLGKEQALNVQVEWGETFLKQAPGKDWMAMDCYQVNFAWLPARLVYMNARLLGLLPFEGRDKYQYGHGNMLIRLLRFFTLGNAKGKEMDASALVTLLAELPLLPAYALQPYIAWTPVDDNTARATLRDNGLEVSGTFYFDRDGALLRFRTEDRFMAGKGNTCKRLPWSAEASGYALHDGLRHPTLLTATWHTDWGDFTYFKGSIRRLHYNIKEFSMP